MICPWNNAGGGALESLYREKLCGIPLSWLSKFNVTLAPAGTVMVLKSKARPLATRLIVTEVGAGADVVVGGADVVVAGAVVVAGGVVVIVVDGGVVVVGLVVVVTGGVVVADVVVDGVLEQAPRTISKDTIAARTNICL